MPLVLPGGRDDGLDFDFGRAPATESPLHLATLEPDGVAAGGANGAGALHHHDGWLF
jgi:hypothetical protein